MNELFPILGLRIRSERLLLRPRAGDDPVLRDLYTSISGKLLQPEENNWMNGDWYMDEPETLYIEAVKNTIRKMIDWRKDDWNLKLFVHREGRAIGEMWSRLSKTTFY